MNIYTNNDGNFFSYGQSNGTIDDGSHSLPIPLNQVGQIDLAAPIVRKFTIGRAGVVGCDFNFAAAADHVQQNLDLGAIIPAKSKVINAFSVCVEAVVGVTDFNIVLGNVSGGAQFHAAGSCNTLNEVQSASLTALLVIPVWSGATHLWVGGDPTDNTWNLMTAGKWEVFITYIPFE